jgi:hypothetical protein
MQLTLKRQAANRVQQQTAATAANGADLIRTKSAR